MAILFPVLSFIPTKGSGVAYYSLLLLSLIGIICRVQINRRNFLEFVRVHWPLHIAMSGLLLATLVNQFLNGQHFSSAYELPLQLACFPFLSWVICIAGEPLKKIHWTIAAAVVFGTVSLYVDGSALGLRPDLVLGVPLVPFTNVIVMMGALSLLSIGWNSSAEKTIVTLKLVTGAVALYASYLSLTRSSWSAVPVFIGIALVVFRNIRFQFKLAIVATTAVIFIGAGLFSNAVRERVELGRTDIELFLTNKNRDTSLGQRLQLWRASWEIFKDKPIIGTGRERYQTSAQQLAQRQIITPFAAAQPHSHSDLLFHMATLGIFGLIAILSLYFVPAYYFCRQIRHPDSEMRTIAGMGMALTLGFFVFGLSDTMFYWRFNYSFYIVLLAMLYSSLLNRQEAMMALGARQAVEKDIMFNKACS